MRVLFCGDMHCGSQVGLTPPGWQYKLDGPKKTIGRQQRECWNFYKQQIESLKPFDLAVINGDIIDGDGYRNGGKEQITTDRLEQAAIAQHAIEQVCAPKNILTYGTPSHTGKAEDFEQLLINELPGAEIYGHAFIDICGWMFDVKHKVGGSTVPHGRHTAVARERVWNIFWADQEGAPKADVVIRSHVHYHNYCGGTGWLGMTLPALQGLGTDYGVRQCSGTVDFGFVYFDIEQEGYRWHSRLLKIKAARPSVVKA